MQDTPLPLSAAFPCHLTPFRSGGVLLVIAMTASHDTRPSASSTSSSTVAKTATKTIATTPPLPAAARACLAYALASSGVTIMNKVVFSHAHFHFPWFTLAFQNLVSVCLICIANLLGFTRSGTLSAPLARSMPFPILFFVLFIFTNAQSLRYVNLPVLTVWKSLGPMFVTLFERLYFGDSFSTQVYTSMLLIVLSAFVTAINDLEYSVVGYFWAAMNVLANVAYLASLRIFLKDPNIPALDKTFHSNLLSIIPILPMALISGEFSHVFNALAERSTGFKLAYFASGFLTTAVCATAFWTISVTNGSTLSFIGGFNKVPIILLSLFLFDMHISIAGWIGVTLGVLAGIVFVKAKTTSKYNALSSDDKDTVTRQKKGGYIVNVAGESSYSARLPGMHDRIPRVQRPSVFADELPDRHARPLKRSHSDPAAPPKVTAR